MKSSLANIGVGLGLLTVCACGPAVNADAASNRTIAPAIESPKRQPASVSPGATQAYTIDHSNQTGIAALERVLVAVGRFDGAPITAFTRQSRCSTSFVTAAGTTIVNWAAVKDWASRTENGHVVIPLDDGTGEHAVSVPDGDQPEPIGNAAAGVEGGFGVLADSCHSGS